MQIVRTSSELRNSIEADRVNGKTVALVPTMGALHDGHLSLVRAAKDKADRAVVSIFVNPKQFAPGEDFARYPRQERKDAELLAGAGADLLYLPEVEAIYPPGFATTVSIAGVTRLWEGENRPGHFDGVATIVAKMLIQAAPDFAMFGEKDYQQLQMIRLLARDLDLPTRIVGSPIVRDEAGLALSSRNAYLSAADLTIARTLNGVLRQIVQAPFAQRDNAARLANATLLENGFSQVDYLTFVDAETLEPAPPPGALARLIAAARLGAVRLLDNMASSTP